MKMSSSSSSSSLIVLRIRTQLGTWRLNDVKLNDNLNTLRKRVESEHRTDLQGLPFTLDAKGLNALDDSLTVQQVKLNNGDFLYAMVDETKTGVPTGTSPCIGYIPSDISGICKMCGIEKWCHAI